jgi:hypothetical protein
VVDYVVSAFRAYHPVVLLLTFAAIFVAVWAFANAIDEDGR